jgi:nucleoside-diphosphate-sugar epimerase
MSTNRILIIGGGGYMGIPLSNYLSNDGNYVMVFDNFKYNTKHLLNKHIDIIDDDVSNIATYSHIFENLDIIYYLASPRFHEITDDIIVNNELSLLRETCKFVSPNTRFIFNSSCSVYGVSKDICYEDTKLSPTTFYSKLKILSEEFLINESNINYLILRIATLFGKSELHRSDLLINKIIDNIRNGKSIDIFDKNSKRPYICIKDCVRILSNLRYNHHSISEKILNIGFNEFNFTKDEIISKVKSSICMDFDVEYIDSTDDRSYVVNFDTLKKYENFKPVYFELYIYDWFC